MAVTVYMPLDTLLANYVPGSFDDWTWQQEYDDLWMGCRDGVEGYTGQLADDIAKNGITDPIQLGPDGRVWDGHHRIIIAMHFGLAEVPIEKVG